MSNKNKNKKLEELSTEELQSRIKEDKKKAGRSVVMMFAAVIAIIVIGIAWFVANTRVSLTSGTISPADPNGFVLASVGSRQTAEQTYLKGNTDSNILNAGETEEHSEYIDVSTGQKVSTGQTTYHVGSSNLAWYLSSDHVSVSPGASGKMEFYIIPTIDNLEEAKIHLELLPYKQQNGKAVVVNDTKLKSLTEGHILLFRSLSNANGYGGWLGEDGTFTISAPNAAGTGQSYFQKDMPYKVSLYWIWPQYFRNYVYHLRSQYGDLFTGKSEDSKQLLAYVNKQKTIENSSIFYAEAGEDESKIPDGNIDENMSDAVLDAWSNYYNQADEYLGNEKNVNFIYVDVTVQ